MELIKGNFIYIIVFCCIFSIWSVGALILKSKKSSKKIKSIAGWTMFGGFWPILNKEENKSLSKREIIFFIIGLLIVIIAFAYTYFTTNGTFIW